MPVEGEASSGHVSLHSQLVKSPPLAVTSVPSQVYTLSPPYSVQAPLKREDYYSPYVRSSYTVSYGSSNSNMVHGLRTPGSSVVYEGHNSTLPYGASVPTCSSVVYEGHTSNLAYGASARAYAVPHERTVVNSVNLAEPNIPVYSRYSFAGVSPAYQ